MKETDRGSAVKNQTLFDRQKIDLASIRYSIHANMPEIRIQIQAPPLEGPKRDRKY